MSNKVALVTGANAGLGFQIALALANEGAHVVMACRSRERGEEARARLASELPRAQVRLMTLDVSEPESIRTFREDFAREIGQLDVLIHNAGVFGVPLGHNSVGHELHLATNYLGPFALTGALLGCLRATPGARVVSVGSLASRFARIDPRRLGADPPAYKAAVAYARSKLALLTFTLELNRRLRRHGTNVIALSAHPGFARTEIAKGHAVAAGQPVVQWIRKQIRTRLSGVAEAARPIVHAACAPDVRGAEYFGPSGWLEITGTPATARINQRARSESMARALWLASERLAGVHYLSEH